jgi:hypothetical protein
MAVEEGLAEITASFLKEEIMLDNNDLTIEN